MSRCPDGFTVGLMYRPLPETLSGPTADFILGRIVGFAHEPSQLHIRAMSVSALESLAGGPIVSAQRRRKEFEDSIREKLSTGQRINHAADAPAALIASIGLTSDITQLQAQIESSERSAAVVQTAGGALGEISSLLQIARQSIIANAGNTSSDSTDAARRDLADAVAGVERLSNSAQFNGRSLLNGTVQVTSGEQSFEVDAVKVSTLGVTTDAAGNQVSLQNLTDASLSSQDQLKIVDQALAEVGNMRAAGGAFVASSESYATAQAIAYENLSAAKSRIEDADYAVEIAALSRSVLLQQAAMGATLITSARPRVVRLLAA